MEDACPSQPASMEVEGQGGEAGRGMEGTGAAINEMKVEGQGSEACIISLGGTWGRRKGGTGGKGGKARGVLSEAQRGKLRALHAAVSPDGDNGPVFSLVLYKAVTRLQREPTSGPSGEVPCLCGGPF